MYVEIGTLFYSHSHILNKSMKLGRGSVDSPIQITKGANPKSRKCFALLKIMFMSSKLNAMLGMLAMATTPLDLRRRGTGMLSVCLLLCEGLADDENRSVKQSSGRVALVR
jgi:hypothetical protein